MAETRDDTLIAFGGSLLLHGGIVAIVLTALWLKPEVQVFDVAGPVIEASLVNFTAPPLPASASRPKPQPPKPEPPKPVAEQPPPQTQPEPVTPPRAEDRVDQEKVRLAAEALEKAEREQEERRKQEQIELEREQDELTKMEQERQKQLEDVRKQLDDAKKKREAEERKLAMLEQQNKQAEADQQRELEQQRMDELAKSEVAQRAGNNGRDDSLLGQYQMAISTMINRNWRRPDNMQEGFRCNVTVTQIPGGDVIAVDTGACAGDPLVIRSLEAAVQREPLPYRGFESVFARKVTIPFCYPEEICVQ